MLQMLRCKNGCYWEDKIFTCVTICNNNILFKPLQQGETLRCYFLLGEIIYSYKYW